MGSVAAELLTSTLPVSGLDPQPTDRPTTLRGRSDA